MKPGMTRRALLGSIGASGMFPPFASAINSAPQAFVPVLQLALRIGEPRPAASGWRQAQVLGGSLGGGLMRGRVRSGHLRWLVDPASGAVEMIARVQLLASDGRQVELRDRTVHAHRNSSPELPGLATAPRLFDAAGEALPQPALEGRFDARNLALGSVVLRAFAPRKAKPVGAGIFSPY